MHPSAHLARPSRRDFLRLAGVGATGLALAACGSGGSASAPADVASPGRHGSISLRCRGSRTSSSRASTPWRATSGCRSRSRASLRSPA